MIGYKAGMHVIERYGHWLFLKQELVEKTHRYYDKYGGPLLLVSFFIPGVRQFISYFIGIIRVPYCKVLLYAYIGGALWVIAFFSVGYFFGEQWQYLFSIIEQYLKFFFIGVAFLTGVWLLVQVRSARGNGCKAH
ncbi:DedA family protein [Paenibacillus polymyxa]|uniref:DedA family protein n=1 Tax=Paenibacillus polymyxa TaxID=1406 RepID=UPI002ED0947C|nr:DedA family protein [Paenibacillus polymyxa]